MRVNLLAVLVTTLFLALPAALQAQPSITSIVPDVGPTGGGQVVIITGTGFTGATDVDFGATAAGAFTVNSDTEIEATTAAATAGQVDVVVTTPGGVDTVTNGYRYADSATITSVTPNQGPEAGGTSVTVDGTNFFGVTDVNFDGTPGTGLNVVSDTQLTVDTPPGTGVVDVVVVAGGGNGTSAGGFEYFASPAISTIVPDVGPLAGGQTVIITGTGFTGATDVDFGATPAGAFTVNSDTEIEATTAAATAGQVDVVVTTPGGVDTVTDGYRYADQATITNVNPSQGPEAGGTNVTIQGTSFFGVTEVTFDGNPGTNLSVTNDTELTVDTPAGTAGLVDVVVVAGGGNATEVNGFEYVVPANNPPVLAAPDASAGDISVGGSAPTFTGSAILGENLAISFEATDADAGDTLVTTVSVTGGTLSAAQAGFNETFPFAPAGTTSPHTVSLTGTAANTGNIVLTVGVDDGNGGSDSYTIDITISSAPTITVTAPNGGEVWLIGQQATVNWTSSGVGGTVDILLSTDGGSTFPIVLATNATNSGAFTVNPVPNNATTQARVRVEDNATGSVFDESDANFTIEAPAPAAVTMSASGNPGSQTANPGTTRTALGFRLTETGGGSTYTVTSVTARVNILTDFNAGESAINSISLRRGSTLLATQTSASWTTGGGAITVNFTGLSSPITAGSTADFNIQISFSGGAAPTPAPQYQAEIDPADVNGGASVSGVSVTGGTITLVEKLPNDPFDDDDDDSCNLSTRGGPAWPMLFGGILVAMVVLRRRAERA